MKFTIFTICKCIEQNCQPHAWFCAAISGTLSSWRAETLSLRPTPESLEVAVLRSKSLTVLGTTLVDVSGIIRYLSFGDWLPSFSIIRFAHAVACAGFPF